MLGKNFTSEEKRDHGWEVTELFKDNIRQLLLFATLFFGKWYLIQI